MGDHRGGEGDTLPAGEKREEFVEEGVAPFLRFLMDADGVAAGDQTHFAGWLVCSCT